MKSDPDRANPNFDHRLAQEDSGRILIRAVCKFCGASELVSAADDSLKKWENTHNCTKAKAAEDVG